MYFYSPVASEQEELFIYTFDSGIQAHVEETIGKIITMSAIILLVKSITK